MGVLCLVDPVEQEDAEVEEENQDAKGEDK